jgi:hypothetical protein
MSETKPPASIDELATLHAQIGERLKGLKGLQERHDDKGGKKDVQQLTPDQIGQMIDLLIARIPEESRQDFLDLHLSGALMAEGGAGMDAATRRRARRDDDDRGEDPGDPDHEATDPKQTASDTATSRADAVRRQRADAAREEAENDDSRYQAQAEFDRVFYALEGTRAPQPLVGERARTYRVRMLRQLQKYSPDHKDVDLKTITDPKLFELTDRRIRADALGVAQDPAAMQKYFEAALPGLREVFTEDPLTGRRISKFYGPVEATLAPFRLPRMRAKFDQDVIRESKRRGA